MDAILAPTNIFDEESLKLYQNNESITTRDIRLDVLSYTDNLDINIYCILLGVFIFGNYCIFLGVSQLDNDCIFPTGTNIAWLLIIWGINLILLSIFYILMISDCYSYIALCNYKALQTTRMIMLLCVGINFLSIATIPNMMIVGIFVLFTCGYSLSVFSVFYLVIAILFNIISVGILFSVFL